MKEKTQILKERRTWSHRLSAMLAIILAVVMVVGMMPQSTLTVYAAAESTQDGKEEDGGFLGNLIDSVKGFFGRGEEEQSTELTQANRVQTFSTEGADKAVDKDTMNNWENFTAPEGVTSTQNVGRIWTDKSVFSADYTLEGSSGASGKTIEIGDSDFLVGLSALSSTSNLKTVTTTTTPLDIVLVVDTSGSMDNGNGDSMGYAYSATYNVRNSSRNSYYVQLENGNWQELTYSQNRGWYYNAGSGWNPDYRIFTPKTSEDDNNPEHTQFYTREQVNKMEALQSAANTFADTVAEMNDGISDASKQHRISLVKFASDENNSIGNGTNWQGYNYSQVVSDLTAYTTNTVSSLKNTINDLYGEGATRADYGLHQAQRVLNGEGSLTGAREGAQKVVIFFTDGEPTSGSSWEDSVASAAIDYARAIKQKGTIIYSIGVVQGADPSDDPTSSRTSNINKFLHAVSSNYKEASYKYESGWLGGGSYEWSFGNRTTGEQGEPDPDYYFAATDANELDQVFEDITSSITDNLGSGSPIEENTSQGYQDPGTLTFTDQLGSYMQVTGIGENSDQMQLVYGDKVYISTDKETNGNIDIYKFEGKVDGNAVYGEADLSTLVVKVQRSDNLATGDLVTVEVPASLIPLRNYDVDTNNNTMTVTPAYPIRLFFGVSVKSDATDALNNPSSDDYKTIVTNNKSSDGTTVDFYSNSFTQGAKKGDTTVSFSPNIGNRFYYYTEDAQLYLDEGFETPATRNNQDLWGDTLYYKDTYWKVTGEGEGEETTSAVTVTRTGGEWASIQYGENGQAYIPSGTKRTDRPATLISAKEDPQTETAVNVLFPEWTGDNVTQYLGNNGKLSLAMPGRLEIKKQVNWGNASDDTKTEKNSFTFTVQLTDEEGTALTGTYPYYIDGADTASGNLILTNGQGEITINGGQSVYIDGLPAGTKFTVTEEGANSKGFKTTDSTSQQGVQNTETDGVVSGTIAAGTQTSTTFTNTYHAADVNLSTDTTLKVQKNLTGRDWRDSDTFTFEIDGLGNTAGSGITTPEPGQTTVTVTEATENKTASFGDITFTAPGEYRYAITEDNDTEPIPGIDYSAAIYRVIVTVTDNGEGALEISDVAIEQRQNDDGKEPEQQPSITGDTVVFTNTYEVTNGSTNIDGTKDYQDTTGSNPINADKFTFQIEALGGYETEGGSSDQYTVAAADVPMPADAEGTIKKVYNTGYGFGFGTISYDGNDIGKTFEYKITELAQNKNGDEEAGMSYDSNTEYIVKVTVEEVTDTDGTHIVATPDISKENLKFTNKYDPTDVTLGADGVAPIQGTKTLTGRDMKDGESFYFQLTQTGGPATENGGFVRVLEQPETISVSKDNMINGSADFKFSNLTFSKVGTYIFTVNEVSNTNGDETADGSGMTYDTNIATVTVNVMDNHDGTLKADVIYSNDKHSDTTDKAVFTNTYKASMNYGAEGKGGIAVTKQLTNRPMSAGEFAFTITGTQSDTVSAEEAAARLTEADKNFQNTAAAANSSVTMAKFQGMKFDQDDAGKTFSYIVDEADPETGKELAGVEYDQTQYRVDIEVVDNGNGSMHTLTTVTKIKDADGQEIPAGTEGSVIINQADSDTEGYTVPTFGFINEYNPTPAVIGENAEHQIQVTKQVEGADSPDGVNYSFTLTATGDNADNITGLDDQKQLHVSTEGVIKDGEEQTKTFDELRFTKPGTYTFTVAEDQPVVDDGWYYDTEEKTVTVIVTDLNEDGKYDGKLYIQSVAGSPVVVENVYEAGSVIVGGDGADQQINVKKTVTGQDSNAEFQFKISQVEEDDAKWDNVEAVDPDNFSDTETITNVKQNEPQTVSFDAIKFNKEGTYQFTITEEGAADFNKGEERNGWTYDEHSVTVTVTVTDTDKDGFLEAAVSYDNSEAVTEADKMETSVAAFTNQYTATPAELTKDTESGLGVQKTVTGASNDEDFTFTAVLNVNAENNTGKAENIEGLTDGKLTAEISADFADGDTKTVDFDTVKFTAPGVYVFDVTEDNKAQENSGWTYDGSTKEIIVTVTDDGKGALIASVSGNDPLFTNSYKAGSITTGDGDLEELQITKKVSGAPAAEEFSFELTPAEDYGDKVSGLTDGKLTVSTTDMIGKKDSQTLTFGDLTFNEEGTYTFNVKETNPDPEGESGWTYDNRTAKQIIVNVSDDDKDGKLEAAVEGNNPTFYNTYYKPEDAKSVQDTNGNNIDGQMVGVGDELTYTIDWVNNAVDEKGVPVNADVVITDTVPAGTTLVTNSISEGGVEQDGKITWTFKNQTPGASGQVSFKVTVDEPANGNPTEDITNSADITIGDNGPQTSTVTNPVPSKTETTNPGSIGEGTVLTYQISFTNTDGDNASAEVVDTLTKGQGYNAGSATVQIGDNEAVSMEPASTGDAATGQTLTWNLTGLPDNAEVVITFNVTVTRDAGASVDNTATVNGHKTNTTTTPYPSDSKKDVANADEPTISIDGKLAGVGDTLIYTIDWAAEADGTLTVTDQIPNGTAYVEDSADNDGVYDEDTKTITWTFEDLEKGDKGTVTFEVTITDDAVNYDEISNTASLQIGDSDPKTTNKVTTDIPKKKVENTTPDTGIQVGDTLTYTIEYRNDTDKPATVTVTDILPAGLTYTGVPEGQPVPEEMTNDDGRQVLTWTIKNVEPSNTASTVTFNTVVNENATTVKDPVTNKATVSVGDHDYDTNTTGGDVEVNTGDLTISKEIILTEGQGTEIDTDKEFTFTITLTGTNDQPLTGTYQYKIGDGDTQELDFNDEGQATLNLKHKESATVTGLPEGAKYTVTEADYTADGYTTTSTENAEGTITEAGSEVQFTNTYNPSSVVIGNDTNAGITVQKTFTGRQWTEGDEFQFTISNISAPEGVTAPMPEGTTIIISAEGAVAGINHGAFGSMTFGTVGTYTYEISEIDSGQTGIQYDSHKATVTVEVTDSGNGSLKAEVTYDNTEAETESDEDVKGAAAFTNTYNPDKVVIGGDGNNGIKVQKTLKGRDWAEDESYSFTIKNTSAPDGMDEADIPMPEETTIEVGKPSEGNVNNAVFGEMTFTQAGTYVYEITENAGNAEGMTYDGHTTTVTVAVFENQTEGILWAQVLYDNSTALTESDKYVSDAAAFTNTQAVEAVFELNGTKVLEGRDFQEGDSFTFNVKAEDGAPMPDAVDEDGNITIQPTDGSSADISFGKITFTKAGEYIYHITEQPGNANGMTYDTASHDIIITVTDDNQGGLTAEITVGEDQLTWTNSWTFQSGDSFSLDGTKNMTGKELTDSQFTFRVEAQDGAPMGETLQANFNGAATDNEDGTWTAPITLLKNITYTSAGDYVYLITEVNDGQPGVTYDTTQYRVTVHVASNGDTNATIEKTAGSAEGEQEWTEAGAVVFNNSYKSTGTATLDGAANLAGTKTLIGRDWIGANTDTLMADSFTFLLAPGTVGTENAINDGTIVMPETMVAVQGGFSQGAAVPFNFGDITFNQAGEYVFTISEQQPGAEGFVGNTGGMTYDDHIYTITVSVKDNGKGGLTAEVTDTEGDSNWTNTYKAGPGEEPGGEVLSGSENLNVTKVIDGREWQEDDSFTFVLTGGDDATNAAINAEEPTVILPENAEGITIDSATENHQAAFGDITFTEAGNYVFNISEQIPADDEKLGGMTYDETVRVIEVSVTDNLDGTLTAQVTRVSPEAGLTFTNTYQPGGSVTVEPAEGQIQLTKVLEGKAWDGDSFTFEITAKSGTAADGTLIRPESGNIPMPEETSVTVNAPTGKTESGSDIAVFGFGPITYEAAGTYVYEVREAAGTNPGMTYSQNVATVTVTVTDNLHGGYAAAVSITGETFTNTYATSLDYNSEGGLNIIKNLANHDIGSGQFGFTVTPADSESAEKADLALGGNPVTGEAVTNSEGIASATIPVFSSMQFTQADSGKEYTYTISENQGDDAGYTYDGTTYTVVISVADDGNGILTVTTTVSGGADGEMTYTYDNTDSAYEPASVTFNNSYNATGELGGNGEVSIQASKELTNRDQVAGEFNFIVTDKAGNTVATGSNSADGSISFSPISYSKETMFRDAANGIAQKSSADGKDIFAYQYTVSEDTSNLPEGVAPVAASFQITVTVTDNNDGTLGIAVTYPEENGSLTFRNTYGASAEASVYVGGSKNLEVASGDNAPDIAGQYTFEISGSEGAPMPERTTATNDAAGNVSFGYITYTMENVFGDSGVTEETPEEDETEAENPEEGQTPETDGDVQQEETAPTEGSPEENAESAAIPDEDASAQAVTEETPVAEENSSEVTGTTEPVTAQTGENSSEGLNAQRSKVYTYTITETGNVSGVTNDPEVTKTFMVTVTDNGDGTITASSSEIPGAQFSYTNTYSVTPLDPTSPTDGAVTITKELTGRDMTEGEFHFVMTDSQGQTVAEGTNGAEGSVTLSGVSFDTPGTYNYDIKEQIGDLGGVDYDRTVYKASAEVTDNGDGTLSVNWTVANTDGEAVDSIVFHNEYSYGDQGTDVNIGAVKVLDGRELKNGEFTFLLTDSNGELVSKAVNNENGSVQFATLTFTEPGTYTYTVSEEKGDMENITYDDTVYTVTITVTDSLKGYLEAAVDFGGEVPVFTNRYTAPEEPAPSQPEEPEKDEPDQNTTTNNTTNNTINNTTNNTTNKTTNTTINKTVNEKTTTTTAKRVKTGDETNAMIWIVLGGVAVLVFAGGVISVRRRKRNNK